MHHSFRSLRFVHVQSPRSQADERHPGERKGAVWRGTQRCLDVPVLLSTAKPSQSAHVCASNAAPSRRIRKGGYLRKVNYFPVTFSK